MASRSITTKPYGIWTSKYGIMISIDLDPFIMIIEYSTPALIGHVCNASQLHHDLYMASQPVYDASQLVTYILIRIHIPSTDALDLKLMLLSRS